MRKLLFLLVCGLWSVCDAQDIITMKKNGEEIISKVVEVTESAIKYKKWENLDGPVYNISVSEIFQIKYANGQKDFFGDKTSSPTIVSNSNSNTSSIQPKQSESNFKTSIEVYDGKNYPIPNLTDIPYYYDKEKNTLIELEHADLITERRHSGIWGRVNVIYTVGISSNVRFSKKKSPTFIIRLEDDNVNPSAICELNTFEVKGQREYIDTKSGAHGTQKQEGTEISFTKIGVGLYQITLPKSVERGELFFRITSTKEGYAFGYDK